MSAALQPNGWSESDRDIATSGDPAGADAEGWALLEGLRRRLDDLSTQTRKTGAQVGQLAESIAAMVETQRNRSRWLNINSFVAYVMFTVLCGGAFYFLHQSRTRELVAARDRAAADRDAAVKRADAATAALAARVAAQETATRAAQPDAAHWDPVVKAANAAYQAGQYKEVLATLDRELSQHAAPTPDVHYLMGLAALKSAQIDPPPHSLIGSAVTLGNPRRPLEVPDDPWKSPKGDGGRGAHPGDPWKSPQGGRAGVIDAAVQHLRAAIAAEVAQDDARFHLAAALERAGQSASARMEYDRFVAEHPQSPSASVAQRRSAALARGSAAPSRRPVPTPAPEPEPAAAEPAPAPE